MTIFFIFHVNECTHHLKPDDGGWRRPIKGQRCRGRRGAPALARCGVANAGRASLDEEWRGGAAADVGGKLCGSAESRRCPAPLAAQFGNRKGGWLLRPGMGRQTDGRGSRQNAHNGGVHHGGSLADCDREFVGVLFCVLAD